ncbi:MAG: hypothetical protein R3362_08185, partial [Rhodothermales bacterium]|nr:hypothetical protein [Rhodothermales bacterium]
MNRTVRLLALTAFLFPGCDSAVDCSADPDCVEPGATVLVGNQGNFTDQTGSVTVYDATADEATQNALGVTNALVQGLYLDPASDDRLFVLLNFNDSFSTGRGRVDVVDLASNTVTAQIDVDTPRSAYRDGDVLWVTNLYGDTVTPIDLTTNTAGTPVDVGTNPEGLTRAEGGLYVADNGFGLGTTVSVVDPAARTVARTLDLACDGPKTLATDAEGEVWVFCTGKTVYDEDFNVIEQTNGGVVVLDGATGAEVTRFDLPGQLGAGSILG